MAAKKKKAKAKATLKKAAKPSTKKKAAKKAAKKTAKKQTKRPAKKATKPSKATKATTKAAKPSTKKAPAKKKAAKVADVKKVAKVGPKPTTTLVQHVFIQATPEQVFDALVDPAVAAAVIGGECDGAPVVGGTFHHWNNYITGKHLELVRGERIVQEWTTTEWPKGAAPSRVEFQLTGTGGGTELTMTHSQVPSEQAEEYRQGWIDFYWTPLRAYFGG
jgi:uncharacterized protein YndB with AHSA1/START domain